VLRLQELNATLASSLPNLTQLADKSPCWTINLGKHYGDWSTCEKEKGRLLAPSLQSRKETAAEHSPVLPGQADHDKSRWLGSLLASRCLVKDCLTRPRLATAGPDLGSRRDAVPFRTLSKPFYPSVSCIARQALTCRAVQDSDESRALAKRL
jgi:hypothetical protein